MSSTMIFVFLWLTSLSITISRSIHCCKWHLFHCCLQLSSIPLCIYTTSLLLTLVLLEYTLQCDVSFRCIAKWLSYTYTYIPLIFFSILVYPRMLSIVPNSRTLFIDSICNTEVPSIPLPSPLATTSLFSLSVSFFLFHNYIHLCHILDSTYKWYHMVFFSDLLHLL